MSNLDQIDIDVIHRMVEDAIEETLDQIELTSIPEEIVDVALDTTPDFQDKWRQRHQPDTGEDLAYETWKDQKLQDEVSE